MARLTGKTALITGAARGIGAAIGSAFINEGAFVYVTDIDERTGKRTARTLGSKAMFFRLDVREEIDRQQCMSEVSLRDERLDVLVNNAGITGLESDSAPQDPEHASLDGWRRAHRTNLDGVFLGCREAIRAMRPTRAGSIINISSRSGLVGIPAAVRNHTKSVALYCAEQGLAIRCNSIHPAAILTPMWEPMLGSGTERERNMEKFVRDTPLRRFGLPEKVAALAVLLASDEATYITGADLNIDGGLLAGSSSAPNR